MDTFYSPYKEVDPFEECDQNIFFGRDRETKKIISELYRASFTVYYGASGVGKTSLIRAKLIPDLRNTPGIAVVLFRSWQQPDFIQALRQYIIEAVKVATITNEKISLEEAERDFAIDKLLDLIQESDEPHADTPNASQGATPNKSDDKGTVPSSPKPKQADPENQSLEYQIKRRLGLAETDVLDHVKLPALIKACAKHIKGRVFFIFDQFEEYFLYNQGEVASRFESEISDIVNDPEVPAHFLISMREDGLSKLDRLRTKIPSFLGNLIRLDFMDKVSAKAAICEPVNYFNKQYNLPKEKWVKIEDGLVDRLLVDLSKSNFSMTALDRRLPDPVTSSAQDSQIDTAGMQMVMSKLWKVAVERYEHAGDKEHTGPVLNLQDYDDLKGARGIASGYVEEKMEKSFDERLALTNDSTRVQHLRNVAAAIFKYLVTRIGSKYAPTVGDLESWTSDDMKNFDANLNYNHADITTVLETLESIGLTKLLASSDPGREKRFELKHDVLGDAVKNWREKFLRDAAASKAKELAEAEARIEAEKADKELKLKLKSQSDRFRRRVKIAIGSAVILGATYIYITEFSDSVKRLKWALYGKIASSYIFAEDFPGIDAVKITALNALPTPSSRAVVTIPPGLLAVLAITSETSFTRNFSLNSRDRSAISVKFYSGLPVIFSIDKNLIYTIEEGDVLKIWNVAEDYSFVNKITDISRVTAMGVNDTHLAIAYFDDAKKIRFRSWKIDVTGKAETANLQFGNAETQEAAQTLLIKILRDNQTNGNIEVKVSYLYHEESGLRYWESYEKSCNDVIAGSFENIGWDKDLEKEEWVFKYAEKRLPPKLAFGYQKYLDIPSQLTKNDSEIKNLLENFVTSEYLNKSTINQFKDNRQKKVEVLNKQFESIKLLESANLISMKAGLNSSIEDIFNAQTGEIRKAIGEYDDAIRLFREAERIEKKEPAPYLVSKIEAEKFFWDGKFENVTNLYKANPTDAEQTNRIRYILSRMVKNPNARIYKELDGDSDYEKYVGEILDEVAPKQAK